VAAEEVVEAGLTVVEEALWRLVSNLANCLTPLDVAGVLAQEGGAAAGGVFANMAVCMEGSNVVRVVHSPAVLGTNQLGRVALQLNEHLPACDAIRTGLPVLLGTMDDVRERYPSIVFELQQAGLKARASLPIHSASGDILGAVGFGWAEPQEFTVTQLRRLDLIAQLTGLALQRSSHLATARPTQVLDTMPIALLSLNSELRVIYVNAEAERILHRSREAVVGRDLVEIFPEPPDQDFVRLCTTAFSHSQANVSEVFLAGLGGWFEIHAWPDQHGLNLYLTDITERRHLESERMLALDETERDNARLTFLSQLNSAVAGSSTSTEVFDQVSRTVVAHVADWCTVVVPLGVELVRVAAAHRSTPLDHLAKRLVGSYPHAFDGPSPGVVVYRTAEPLRLDRLAQQIVADLDDSVASTAYGRTLQQLGDGPGLIMPIFCETEVAAILTMVRASGEAFSDADVQTLTQAAACISASLDDVRKIAVQRQTASALQEAALPKALPDPVGLVLAAGYRAASQGEQVGGDWYDAFELQSGRVALVVGDAAGHGLQAAALMTQMRNVLRGHLFAGLRPSESLAKLSRLIATQEPDGFATIICAEIDPGTGHVTWTSAGHPMPILLRSGGGSTHLQDKSGPPIGFPDLDPDQCGPEYHLDMKPGDRLIMFTDGIVETRHVDIEIGITHLMLTIEQTRDQPNTARACDAIIEQMLPTRHEDDVCLLVADFMPDPMPDAQAARRALHH